LPFSDTSYTAQSRCTQSTVPSENSASNVAA